MTNKSMSRVRRVLPDYEQPLPEVPDVDLRGVITELRDVVKLADLSKKMGLASRCLEMIPRHAGRARSLTGKQYLQLFAVHRRHFPKGTPAYPIIEMKEAA